VPGHLCIAGRADHRQALIVLVDPAPYLVAVTGGSGKYKGVEGEIHVDPVSETQPRGILTFHLLRPNPQLPRAQ
jgi:hypothetical protein